MSRGVPEKGEGPQEHASCKGWHQRKGRVLRIMFHARGGTRERVGGSEACVMQEFRQRRGDS
jgi:hypothetical protein